MRTRTLLLCDDADDAVARGVARDLVRLGAEARSLEELTGGARRIRGFTVVLDDEATVRLSRRAGVARVLSTPDPHPLASKRGGGPRVVQVRPSAASPRDRIEIGGDSPVVIAGPCAIESEEQLEACARAVAGAGGRLLRAGAYKPRTSPYAFAGGGREALGMLRAVAERHRLAIVTEVLDPRDVDVVAAHADVLQIGARTMGDVALLRAVGQARMPVLLKRAPSATLDDLLSAAEHLLHAGAADVILCERGVRGFDPAARNLLDLAAVPLLRLRPDLPVIVDPSHGVGVRAAVLPLAAAAIAAGADGVIVECHPDPASARSDGVQALTLDALPRLFAQTAAIAAAARPALAAAAE
ncbi:MAG: 3-deoxy-7-phosphoheptulonate synthase [Polyangiales bacterium]